MKFVCVVFLALIAVVFAAPGYGRGGSSSHSEAIADSSSSNFGHGSSDSTAIARSTSENIGHGSSSSSAIASASSSSQG